MKRIWCNWTW